MPRQWHRPWHMSILSSLRGEPQQSAGRGILEQPERPVGALRHEADSGAHVELLGLRRTVARYRDADQSLAGEGADEGAALPLGERAAGVEDEARRRDGRVPPQL